MWSSSSERTTCRNSSCRRDIPTGTPILKGSAWTASKRRYPEEPPEYLQQLRYEMDMIRKMGFVDYFPHCLRLHRLCQAQRHPVGPGRGSAAGSVVSYCLDITDVEPMKYSLYFERFLNPERVTMPDIDIDFCIRRRQEVIDYVCRKYGSDHVAQIVTFGTMAARGAIRDVGRALNFPPYAEVDQIAKLVPSGRGRFTSRWMNSPENLQATAELYGGTSGSGSSSTLPGASRECPATPPRTLPAWSSPACRWTTMCLWRKMTNRWSPSIP